MARVAARQFVSRDAFDFERWWWWDEVDGDDDFGRILDACLSSFDLCRIYGRFCNHSGSE